MSPSTFKPSRKGAKTTANVGFAPIPQDIAGLFHIYGSRFHWGPVLGPIPPANLYHHFHRHLEGTTQVDIHLRPTTAEIIIKNDHSGSTLTALVSKDQGAKALNVSLLKVEGEKYAGRGKAFLRALPSLCQTLSVSKIETSAGLSDGPFFWARHGFTVTKETELVPFITDAFRNHRACKSLLSGEANAAIDLELGRFCESSLTRIAQLSYTVKGKPVGAALLQFEENVPMRLDFNNAAQKDFFLKAISQPKSKDESRISSLEYQRR